MRTLTILLLLALAACTDPVDKAAKKRIFSPEDPPKAVASAADKLPPENVADDPKIARRILGMGAAETTQRIGPHKYSAAVTFEWSGNSRQTKLVENRTLIAGPGGVSGDFQGVIENNRDQGLEVLRVGGQVFAKSRYGKFRQRLRDRGIAEREREEIYGALKDIDELFRGRLKLTPQGTVSHEGRTAWKYEASLGPPMPPSGDSKLPPAVKSKNGVDDTTRLRLEFLDKRDPKILGGEVLVDAETSVVLKARIDGRLTVAGEGGEAGLRMVLDSAMSDIGKDPLLKPPADFLPDQDKPLGIADALDKFGIPHGDGKKDAGVSAPGAPEPEDEG